MKKFSTKTLTAANEIVPWLAANGPLSYTPENPPDRDYFFQYGWIMPELLGERAEKKRHHFFGAGLREDAREIFEFWRSARAGRSDRIAMKFGRITPFSVQAPIAIYRHEDVILKRPWYMLIQHGSYQYVEREEQPEIESGIVYLYRGIQNATDFRYLNFCVKDFSRQQNHAWLAYLKTQAQVLSDSVISFNSIHDRTVRSETTSLNDRSRMTDEIAIKNGLRIDAEDFADVLWTNHHQCFALERWVAERKFGPNFVICKTPITNIRITTFFAGEVEAKVIDPNKLKFVKTVGCEWRVIPV